MIEHSGNCNKCGICLSVCPVYAALKEEQSTPRAKLRLIKALESKSLSASDLLKELVDKCLMCGSCQAICPSGVDHISRYMEVRGQLAEEVGELKEVRSLIYMLAREKQLGKFSGIARLGRKLLPDFVQQKTRLGDISLRQFPELNRKALRNALPEVNEPEGKVQGTVLYFTGCATNYMYDDTGYATVDLLNALGFRVIIPKKQTCCSIPMLYHGAFDQARKNIEINIACLNDPAADAIIVDCPTCRTALKHEFPATLQRFGEGSEAALPIADKTMDLMDFVHSHLDLLQEKLQEKGVGSVGNQPAVTYHAPCHLRNDGPTTERLLTRLPQINYRPAVDCNSCCGGGGTFFYSYPDVAKKMAAAKVANARKTGAKIWLTDCPVCRLHLSGQQEEKEKLQVMHPAQYFNLLMK